MSATRFGLLADVHANLPALRTALARLREAAVDQLIVAGDLVGYGASPNECVELLASRSARCVAGNHDLLFLDQLPVTRFSEVARHAAEITRPRLGEDTRRYLAGLPIVEQFGGFVVAHGSLTDPEEYVQDRARAKPLLAAVRDQYDGADTLVLGHTHRHWVVRDATSRLVNPGSVGQSREAEARPRVRAAIIDTEAGTLTFHRWAYDVERAGELQRALDLSLLGIHHPPSPRTRVARRLPARVRRAAHLLLAEGRSRS